MCVMYECVYCKNENAFKQEQQILDHRFVIECAIVSSQTLYESLDALCEGSIRHMISGIDIVA